MQLTISSVAVCPLRKCLYSRCASAGKLLSEVTCHGTSPRLSSLRALRQEHLALPCPIWKITRGSLHGLIKDSLEWSMVASQPAAGIARALIRGNNDFHLKQSPTSRLQMADSRHPACEKMTRTTRGLYCTANTGLLVSQCAAHSSTPRPTAEMMMQTRVTTKW